MQLKQQMWLNAHFSASIFVKGLSGCAINEFYTRHGQAHLYCCDHGLYRLLHAVKSYDAGAYGFWLWMQLQGKLCDQPQRAFGSHQKRREIVAGRRFTRPVARLYHLAIRKNNF